ncbi:FAD/NAD(P)-binding domain-containing protein [Glonium stellatum]|uniref:FAD/NAD(P)-binding domain-containing protein n=1 Tax=Glonium stellatum TaxID=574774 RepID=A0A8E2JRP3_9PEZI|nr:FAD/NAD(P)-binding domain-containing protein [Glonium stellatum]
MAISKVTIVGAGPSGLLLAIMLAKQHIGVQVLDAGTEPDKNPRAAHYAPSAVYDFARAGVINEINAEGFHPDAVCWREADGTFLAGMKRAENIDHPMVVLPLDRLGPLLCRHLQKNCPTAEILWSHKVIGIEQDETEARVQVETPDGVKMYSGDYVIGADGANSQIRRSLFGNNYPGETLNAQIIATNVYLDFKEKFGFWDSNFIVHPTNWYMAARITNDGLWRVTYGDIPGLSNEDYLERQPQRYEEILPGHPKPGEYKLVSASPYKLQQRCAEKFRVGRFLLMADAAHLCNPFGGMGLTGGFADVGSLYDCLVGIHDGLADESILDKYSNIRQRIWREMIDPISRANFHRLWDEGAIGEREKFFALCNKAWKDENLNRELTMGIHAVRHDFTQYYNKSDGIKAAV